MQEFAEKILRGLRRVWPWLAAILSGILLALGLAPWNLGPVCWVALVPLTCAVWFAPPTAKSGLRNALLGYVTGLVFFSTAFYWLSSLGTLFEQSWLHGLSVLLALYMGLYVAVWAWWMGGLARPRAFTNSGRNLLTGLLGASAWVSLEWVRGWLFSGFGWNNLGVALHRDLALIQIVDLTGVAGLSFLVAFCNLMAVIIIRRLRLEFGPAFLKRMRWEFSATMALVAAVFAYGVRSLLQKSPVPTQTVRIAAIQPNIPQSEKFSAEADDAVMEKIRQLTELASSAKPQLVLWPESATPGGLYSSQKVHALVTNLVDEGRFGLLVGTIDSDLVTREDFNTATLLTPKPEQTQTYRKMHLVPFGEYLPLRKSFPLFQMVAGDLVPADFTPGREFTVMRLDSPALKFSPLICFEDTLGDLTRRFVQNGTQLLVNITNDGWFLETAGPEQHLANAIFRAVENRRPLVRCANTGVTASIDPAGRVDRWLKPFQSGFAVREISVPAGTAPLTFYTRHGDWLIHGCVLICGLQVVTALLYRKRP